MKTLIQASVFVFAATTLVVLAQQPQRSEECVGVDVTIERQYEERMTMALRKSHELYGRAGRYADQAVNVVRQAVLTVGHHYPQVINFQDDFERILGPGGHCTKVDSRSIACTSLNRQVSIGASTEIPGEVGVRVFASAWSIEESDGFATQVWIGHTSNRMISPQFPHDAERMIVLFPSGLRLPDSLPAGVRQSRSIDQFTEQFSERFPGESAIVSPIFETRYPGLARPVEQLVDDINGSVVNSAIQIYDGVSHHFRRPFAIGAQTMHPGQDTYRFPLNDAYRDGLRHFVEFTTPAQCR